MATLKMVKIILKTSSNANELKDSNGLLPLHCAIKTGIQQVIELPLPIYARLVPNAFGRSRLI